MKCMAFAMAFLPIVALGQSDKDIHLVQRDYYSIPYGMQLSILAEQARAGKINQATLQTQLATDVPEITLSNFKTGNVSDILDRKLSEVATIMETGKPVLMVDVLTAQANEPFGSIKAHWEPRTGYTPPEMTVHDMVSQLGDRKVQKYTRYVSYTVFLRYQGRTLNYQATELISTTPSSTPMVIDTCLEASRYSQFEEAYLPNGVLQSKWREVPAIRDWLTAHTVSDDSCKGQSGVCCLEQDHCGVRNSEFNRMIVAPIGQAKPPSPSPRSLALPPRRPISAMAQGDNPTCVSDDVEYCICNNPGQGCGPVPPPYSTTPNASCQVRALYRKVKIGGVPTGHYHVWITTIVRLGAVANESFDAGPTGNCIISCGYLDAWAQVGNHGHLPDDTLTNSVQFYSDGFSTNNCDSVYEIQLFTDSWYNDTVEYVLDGSPNSNTFAHDALDVADLTPAYTKPPVSVPGW